MIRVCKVCEIEFDLLSVEKQKAGGLSIHCADCSEEMCVKYLGIQAADGKQNQATILKFETEKDKNKYQDFWKNNSGYNKGKSCQLGNHLSTDPGIKFTTVQAFSPTNHKGKS